MNDDTKIEGFDTLVLSGNSSRSIVTLGAIQYAYDNYLLKHIKYYIGTSSGAIICYLLIIGYTPIEIIVYICTHQLMEKMQHFNIVAMIQGRGASSFNNLQEQLEKMTIDKLGYLPTLEDLKTNYDKTLMCITHNLTKNTTEYLSYKTHPRIPCITALHMSANLPLIFEKYKYGNDMYVDGGISNNFGINIADKMGNKILGLLLDNTNEVNIDDMNTIEFIYNLMFIPIQQSIKHKISKISNNCKIIYLTCNEQVFFHFNINSKNKLEMFSSGYKQMQDKM